MLFECATITSVSKGQLSLRSIRGSACERCARGQGCGGGVIGKLAFRGQPTLSLNVTDANTFEVGESVELSVDASRVMVMAACIYLFPLAALLAGAVAGQALFGTNIGAIGMAGLALVAAFYTLHVRLRRFLDRWLLPSVRSRSARPVAEDRL